MVTTRLKEGVAYLTILYVLLSNADTGLRLIKDNIMNVIRLLTSSLSVSLDQAETLPPLAAAALLRQTAEALPSRVYLPLVSAVPADNKYLSEVRDT